MKKLSVSTVLFSLVLWINGQNLVPNCDFDLVTSCPTNTGELDRARDWYTPGEGTSDLCHECGSWNVNVPDNMWGEEAPYSGEGYANLICYHPMQGNDYKEYIQVRLACQLLAGETYNVSFYVSLSDNSRYAIDGIGLLFTDQPITQNGTNVIDPGSPGHIYNPPGVVITQKSGWKGISGQYTAAGGEEYITIGSFIPEGELTIQSLPVNTSYYTSFYVDMVSVKPVNPVQLLGNDTILCYGESILLSATPLCSGSLTWDDGTAGPVRLVTAPGTYSVSAQIGCSVVTDEITVSWFPEPQLALPPDTILCYGDSFWLQPGDFVSYLWQDGSQGSEFLADGAGVYWVEITDAMGCPYRDTVAIEWLEAPAVELGEDLTLCFGDSLLLDAGSQDLYTTWIWQDSSAEPYLTVKQEGLYSVVVSNPCGSATDDILVGFRNCEPLLTIPNAFTPNGDGRNDTFRALGVNISNYRMQVFNRWGELIFVSYDPSSGWDGTRNGTPCAGDMYVWSVYYESDALEETFRETVKGTVMLIR